MAAAFERQCLLCVGQDRLYSASFWHQATELQRNSSREQRAQTAQEQAEPDYFYRVHANPRSDSRENLYMLQAYIPQDNGRAKIGDVLYVGTPERCRELMDPSSYRGADAGGVKELYAKEQEQPTQEPAPEPEQEPVQEPEPEITPAQEVTSDAEPQAAPAETLTELQEKALESLTATKTCLAG